MGKCVIFCAGEFQGLAQPLEQGDYVIAADGGVQHTQKLNIIPHAVLGDFDSLGYTPVGANVFPVEKDDTDAMLAIRQGRKLGYREFVLYGGMDGPRLDHTMANFQALAYLCSQGAFGYLVGKNHIATVMKEETLRFPADCPGIVSVFCMGADARGVTLEGLYYPLREGTLRADFPLGVSNHFTQAQASIQVKQGTLLVIWENNGVFPTREPLF